MEEVITSIARYLIIKRLSNDVVALLAVKEYLIDGEPPSVIAFKYKISKFKVRGYIQRVIDKAGNYRVAVKVVESLYPYIMSIEPIMLRSGSRMICTICNTYVRINEDEQHIRKKHKDLLNELIRSMVARLKH